MTLLVDTKQPEPIEIGSRKYHMQPASVAQRSRWRRAVAAAGGRQHGPLALLNGLSAGVKVLMKESPAPVRDAVLAKIDAQRSRVMAFFEAAKGMGVTLESNQQFLAAGLSMNEGDANLAAIVAEVTEGYPAYAEMVADETMYWQIAGIEAARMFCVAWEGIGHEEPGEGDDAPPVLVPMKLERDVRGVTDDCLAEIPESDFRLIGQQYENLVSVTPAQRKNLLSRRRSSPAGEISST